MAENIHITTSNIEEYRGEVDLDEGSLPFGIWDVFDKSEFDKCENALVVPIEQIVSSKNELADSKFIEGTKEDPRIIAYRWMTLASSGKTGKRRPITVSATSSVEYLIEDGNATAQVLMLAAWKLVPVEVVGVCRDEKVNKGFLSDTSKQA